MVTQTFTTSQTWVAPGGVYSVQIECVGPGGSGGAAALTATGPGGGGGGAYAKKNAYTVVPGNSYTITVGTGGAAVTSNSNTAGNPGSGKTSFKDTGTTICEADFGRGGGAGANGASPGGVGGLAANSTGDTTTSGTSGGAGTNATGGAAGAGGAAAAPLGGAGGAGGSGAAGAGVAPGGGSGGGSNANATAAGAAGEVVLTYVFAGSGTGSITFAASGSDKAAGTGTGAIALTATGSDTAPGSGTGAITLSAAGTDAARSTGTGAITFGATGSGTISPHGTAAMTLTGTMGAGATGQTGTGSMSLFGLLTGARAPSQGFLTLTGSAYAGDVGVFSRAFKTSPTSPGSAQFIADIRETSVQAYQATSGVTVTLKIANPKDGYSRYYWHQNASIQVTLTPTGGTPVTQTFKAPKCVFGVQSGATVTLGKMQFLGVRNTSGTVHVSIVVKYPSGLPTTFTMVGNQPLSSALLCAPTAPTWGVPSSELSYDGTAILLNWVNHEGVNNHIPPDAINNLYTSLTVLYGPKDQGISRATTVTLGKDPITGWPTRLSVPTTPGVRYLFQVTAGNGAGVSASDPLFVTALGTPPITGATAGDVGGDTTSPTPATALANYLVAGSAQNQLNASLSLTPKAAATVDATPDGGTLATSAVVKVNACGDPRTYWSPTIKGGNTLLGPYVTPASRADYVASNAATLPAGMSLALAALGLAAVDAGLNFTFANSNANANTSPTIYIGGDPANSNSSALLAMSYAVPGGANTVGLSFMAYANSANTSGTRAPFTGIMFKALSNTGTALGNTVVNVAPITVNQLSTFAAQWALPANTARVVAAAIGNPTTTGQPWSGGLRAGETVTASAFLVGFDPLASQWPYFDGGSPAAGVTVYDGGPVTLLALIPDSIDGNAGVLP